MEICVIGAGYVGLVTGACLSYFNNQVTVVDANKERVKMLKKGVMPFFEPGLSEIVQNTASRELLEFTDNLSAAVKKAKIIFIAVGTPSLPGGEPDLSQVIAVAKEIGAALDTGCKRIIVNKSTVPVGSANWVEMLVTQGIHDKQAVSVVSGKSNSQSISRETPAFSVVSNPEFLREGSAIIDTLYPDRIVVGSSDKNAVEIMRKLYEPILDQSFDRPAFIPEAETLSQSKVSKDSITTYATATVPFIVTDLASAELIKYAANAFLALKISFANEISGLCEKAGADIRQVTRGIGLDKRIGQYFLNAGIGWGGSCFGKDIHALIESAKEYSYPTPILEAALSVNERQRKILISKLQEELKIIKGRVIGLMGLSFKPNTDDLRDAPSLAIINQLLKMGAFVKVYDPVANESCKNQYPDLSINYCADMVSLAKDCDALLLVTEWDEFGNVDWKTIGQVMKTRLIIDGRNVLLKEEISKAGFTYRGVGH